MKEAHSVSDHAPARRTAPKPRWYWVSLAILLIVIGIMVLYEVCKPFDWKRRVLWGAMAGSSAVTILGFGGSFGLSPLGTQAFLVLLVFLGLAYSIMRFMLGLFDQGERLLNRGRHLRKRR